MGENIRIGRVAISSFVGDAVAIFWAIMGCFFFQSGGFKKVVKNTFFKILIPSAGLIVFYLFFYEWVVNRYNLLQSVTRLGSITGIVKYLFSSFITWTPIDRWLHLHYIYDYVLIVGAFPVLREYVALLDKNRKHTVYFWIMTFAIFLMNDITLNNTTCFSMKPFQAVVPACAEVIWGHTIWQRREYLRKKRKRNLICGVIGYVGTNIFRTICMIVLLNKGCINDHILYWYSSFSLLTITSLMVVACTLIERNDLESAIRSIIYWISSHTFYIYLVQYVVIDLLISLTINSRIEELLVCNNMFSDVVYTFLMTIIVFIGSLTLAVLIKGIKSVYLRLQRLL